MNTLFLDTSGSVAGSIHYWSEVAKVLAIHGPKIQSFYFWNSELTKTDKKKLEANIESRKGGGGTCPENVAKIMIDKGIKRIILVTDGEVSDDKVKLCDEILVKFKIESSICYIISTCSESPNMSVTCPFTRNCENQVYLKAKNKDIEVLAKYTPQDFKILDQLEQISLDSFEKNYDLIQGLIISLNMGKQSNIPLKNQLVVMKNRLVKEYSKVKAKGDVDISQTIRENLQMNDFGGAIQEATRMAFDYFHDDTGSDIEKKISRLINLCGNLRGKYSIGEIKSNAMSTAKDAIKAKVDMDIEVNDLSKNPIECPIILDEDVPQILIDVGEPILQGFEKKVVDDIAACPLRILNYPDVKAKFKARLSNFMGVKFSEKIVKNPFTQNQLLGAIPLGTHHSHVKVGNYTMAQLISGGKILGNLNLYYAAVWYIITSGEIEYLKPIECNATQHLVFRLKNSKTMASLCGQAQFVTTQINTDVAIWYCVNSGYMNQPTDRDTFRFHFYNMEPMIRITNVLGYPNDKGLMPHLNRTRALINMLNSFKKLNTNEKKSYLNVFKGLYQNGIFPNLHNISKQVKELEVCSLFIPIDGPASQQQVLKIRDKLLGYLKVLSDEEIHYLSTLLDAQKSASDIFLDYKLKAPPLPKAVIEWKYGLQIFKIQVPICPLTLRPYYHVKGGTWQEAAKMAFKIDLKDMFKGNKYYLQLVAKYKKIPTVDQLLVFYYNRYIEAGKNTVLPYQVFEWAEEKKQEYDLAFEKYKDFEDILKTIEKSRNIQTRIEMEKAK